MLKLLLVMVYTAHFERTLHALELSFATEHQHADLIMSASDWFVWVMPSYARPQGSSISSFFVQTTTAKQRVSNINAQMLMLPNTLIFKINAFKTETTHLELRASQCSSELTFIVYFGGVHGM